jgi:hypothetical protein
MSVVGVAVGRPEVGRGVGGGNGFRKEYGLVKITTKKQASARMPNKTRMVIQLQKIEARLRCGGS